MSKTVLVTGAAGFIGFHTAQALLARGDVVIGLDNMNPYYDVSLKRARIDLLRGRNGFTFIEADIADGARLDEVFRTHRPTHVVNLAAQAGVRHSLVQPLAYASANLTGFLNVLEGCRHHGVRHLVYASTSSVYGANTTMPFDVGQNVDHPLSLYAATKKANELMAHSYSHLFGLPTTGLRFFTVYGPWGRPDMAIFIFTRAILAGEPIRLFNKGDMQRDFTYIDDVVDGIVRTVDTTPEPDPSWSGADPSPARSAAPWRIYNIGNNRPSALLHVVGLIEQALGIEAIREYAAMQPGDVTATFADIGSFQAATGFQPRTPIEEGIPRFIEWYRGYYGAPSSSAQG